MAQKSGKDLVQSGTEAPAVDPRKIVGGGPLGSNKPIGDDGQKPKSIKGIARPTKQG